MLSCLFGGELYCHTYLSVGYLLQTKKWSNWINLYLYLNWLAGFMVLRGRLGKDLVKYAALRKI